MIDLISNSVYVYVKKSFIYIISSLIYFNFDENKIVIIFISFFHLLYLLFQFFFIFILFFFYLYR